MLLLDGKQFIPTRSDPDQEIARNHYAEATAYIKEYYSQGGRVDVITLIRRKEQKRDGTGILEDTPPMIFPAKVYPKIQLAKKDKQKEDSMGGQEVWAYSDNQPKRKNVGDDYQPDPKSIKFMSHSQGYSMKDQMDLLYFLLYKSPKVYLASDDIIV